MATKGTQLAVMERSIKTGDGSRLRDAEKAITKRLLELQDLETKVRETAYEGFVLIGEYLLEIRTKRLYEDANFKSWSAYCASGRLEYGKRHADCLIRGSELRKKLGAIAPGGDGWTEWQLRELAKCETDNDAKRVAKKAISEAQRTDERVTAKLIAQIRDGETTKATKALDAAALEVHLDKLASIFVKWRVSLEQISLDQWDDVPEPILARAIKEGNALLSFLRS